MSNKSQRRKDQMRRRQENAAVARQRRAEVAEEGPAAVLQSLQSLQVEQRLWQGPIPSPQDLQLYKAVDPHLPSRIVAMAERQLDLAATQQEHRITQEDRAVRGLNRRADVGLWMGFIVALTWFAGSVYLITHGFVVAGSVLGTLDLVALVGIFVYGRHDQARHENANEQQPKRRK